MFDPLEIYAAGIDQSDYVQRIHPLIARLLDPADDLLDVGAGGGQLGRALQPLAARWHAIEPSPVMRHRLNRHFPPPATLIGSRWEDLPLDATLCDVLLAANVAAPLVDTARFLDACRAWARRAIVWVVPAQHGPRGLCLAGCLPREWHGEDETPGIDLVLGALPPARRPDTVEYADWTFRSVVPDLAALAHYLAGRLAWPDDDPRRAPLLSHLQASACADQHGHRLDVPRRSAILHWSL
jgi:hypothetical protein